ncbi:MAG: C10 family peptidase [Prevotellaceae bacterium]|nr:C10 family peptidase [Prevotellaceae bacterium]
MIRFSKRLNAYRCFASILALMIVITSVNARQLTPEAALARMKAATGTFKLKSSGLTQQPKLISTQKCADLSTMYLYNQPNGGGFFILSADDAAPALLAYSDNGTIDMDDLPPAFVEWMNEYNHAISNASKSGKILKAGVDDNDWENIDPLITTLWNQGQPYNYYCPLMSEGSESHRYTGCAATAMGQILKYYNWPKTGDGSVSYTTSTDGLLVEADFLSVTYDWDNMLDSYTHREQDKEGNWHTYWNKGVTEANKQAVGLLLFHLGAAVNMDYKTNGSAANSADMVDAIKDHFRYSDRVTVVNRGEDNESDWEKIIYNELSYARPVYYAGHSDTGGHAFVCDGYQNIDDRNMFHINWGWGGKSNGYFILTPANEDELALCPESQGIGGAGDGKAYNTQNRIIINIIPNNKQYPYIDDANYPYLVDESGNRVLKAIKGERYKFYINCNKGSSEPAPDEYFVDFYNVETNNSYYILIDGYDESSDQIISSFFFTLQDELPGGTYKVYPCYRSGQEDPIRVELPYNATVPEVMVYDCLLAYGNADYQEGSLHTSLVYSWPTYDGVWNSWFVPFAITTDQLAENGLEAACVNGVHQYDDNNDGIIDRTKIEIVKITNGGLRAGVPYFIKPNSSYTGKVYITGDIKLVATSEKTDIHTETAYAEYDFIGTYSGVSYEDAANKYYIMSDKGSLQKTVSYVGALDWYMKKTEKELPFDIGDSSSKDEIIELSIIGEEDQTTGIRTIYSEPVKEQMAHDIYDLGGRKLNQTRPGVNIINGKKYIIK